MSEFENRRGRNDRNSDNGRNYINLESARASASKWAESDFAKFTSSRNKVASRSSSERRPSAKPLKSLPKKLPKKNAESSKNAGRAPDVDSANRSRRSPTQSTSRGASARASGAAKPRRQPKKTKLTNKTRSRIKVVLTLTVILIFVMVTALLCVFLVFKVRNIEVKGDLVYGEADIISVCDYNMGDNLFFLSTTDREEKLEKSLPYIKKAKIKRKIPDTIEINIEGASVVGSVKTDSGYIYVDGDGKILQNSSEAASGIMNVEGITVPNAAPGLKMKIEDTAVQEAYDEILKTVDDAQAQAEFTRIDLSNVHDIRMWYQDRIEMRLGNANSLDYKIRFGLRIVREKTDYVSPTARGVIDLTLSKEENKAPFTEDYSALPVDSTSESGDGGETTPQVPTFADNAGRGDDIPDYPYGYTPPSTDGDGGANADGNGDDTGDGSGDGTDDGYSDDSNDDGGDDYSDEYYDGDEE